MWRCVRVRIPLPTSTGASRVVRHADSARHAATGSASSWSARFARGMSSASAKTKRVSIAPMVDVTDEHFRAFCRLMSRRATLYTPMIVDHTLVRNPNVLAPYTAGEGGARAADDNAIDANAPPDVVVQLAGNSLDTLLPACQRVRDLGYREINLNVGCPANSAQHGAFGVELMRDERFPDVVRHLRESIDIPITVKCRVGLAVNSTSPPTSYDFFVDFLHRLATHSLVDRFVVHARIAVLSFNTSQNRQVPPLQYDWFFRAHDDLRSRLATSSSLSRSPRSIDFELNGGIATREHSIEWLQRPHVSGIMFGRWPMLDIYSVRLIDGVLREQSCTDGDEPRSPSRAALVRAYLPHIERVVCERGERLSRVLAPLRTLCHHLPHGKTYRQLLQTIVEQGNAAHAPPLPSVRRLHTLLAPLLDHLDALDPGDPH